jgi:hypothetical protein
LTFDSNSLLNSSFHGEPARSRSLRSCSGSFGRVPRMHIPQMVFEMPLDILLRLRGLPSRVSLGCRMSTARAKSAQPLLERLFVFGTLASAHHQISAIRACLMVEYTRPRHVNAPPVGSTRRLLASRDLIFRLMSVIFSSCLKHKCFLQRWLSPPLRAALTLNCQCGQCPHRMVDECPQGPSRASRPPTEPVYLGRGCPNCKDTCL